MNEQAKYKLKGFIFMFLSSSAMGGIGAFGRFINAPGDFISFGRNLIGFVTLTLIFVLFARGNLKKIRETRVTPAMVFSGVFLGLLSGLYVISTQYTTLANASFLIYTGPIYSTVLAAIFLKERLSVKGVACIVAVVIGMLFIVGIVTPTGLTLDLDPKWMFGNMIGLLSGVAYGLYLWIGRYRQDCDSNVRSWWNFLFAWITILGLMVVDSALSGGLKYTVKVDGVQQISADGQIMTALWSPFTMDAQSWLVWIAAALVTGFVAFHLLAYATKMLKAGELAAISYQETIMASLLGFALFGEVLTPFQMIGGALIIVGGVSQIVFSTKSANESGDPELRFANQMGGGNAGLVDGTPDGLEEPDSLNATRGNDPARQDAS